MRERENEWATQTLRKSDWQNNGFFCRPNELKRINRVLWNQWVNKAYQMKTKEQRLPCPPEIISFDGCVRLVSVPFWGCIYGKQSLRQQSIHGDHWWYYGCGVTVDGLYFSRWEPYFNPLRSKCPNGETW